MVGDPCRPVGLVSNQSERDRPYFRIRRFELAFLTLHRIFGQIKFPRLCIDAHYNILCACDRSQLSCADCLLAHYRSSKNVFLGSSDPLLMVTCRCLGDNRLGELFLKRESSSGSV